MKKIIALCAFVLGVSLISLCALLIRQTLEQGERMDSKGRAPKLECTLTLRTNRGKVGDDLVADVAIKNISKEILVIDYIQQPFWHLDLQVINSDGKNICHPCRYIYSMLEEHKLTLRPGETYRGPVGIFGTIIEDDWEKPGTYKITAIYEYNGEKAVSKQLELTLTAK